MNDTHTSRAYTNYAHTVTVPLPFGSAVDKVRAALSAQGFGILTEIDVTATLTQKLGSEAAAPVGDYLILGACNPPLALRSIAADPNIGLLLPCNVVVRRQPGADATTVQSIDPGTMVELSGKPGMAEIAGEADTRLRAALASLDQANTGTDSQP